MTYTEDQLTVWFDVEKQKPWEPGVYQIKVNGEICKLDTNSFWNGEYFCVCGSTIERASLPEAIKGKTNNNITHWRGLSQNPNAKPQKRSGNKRKVMYVVQEIANNGMLLRSLASFRDMKHAKSYAASVYCYTRIDKIRFRTPEQD